MEKEIESIIIFLKKDENRYALFLLLKISENNDNLPSFIDRGKEIKILEKFELVRGTQKKKHQHYKPKHLTEKGRRVLDRLEKDPVIQKIKELPTDEKKNFDEKYTELFHPKEEFSNNIENDEYLSVILKDYCSNKKRNFNGVELELLGYNKKEIRENEQQYNFKIRVKCVRCKEEFIFIQKIINYEEQWKPYFFEKPCDNCGYIFRSDSFFSNFSMYER